MFYDETVLPTGLKVVSESMANVRSVAVGFWVGVGSREESWEEAGSSHFLEHMMFKGTDKLSAAEISRTFDRLGAELNAFTGKEYTCYYSRVLDEHLPIVIETLSDMVARSKFEQDACVSEREVVLEEISRYEDTPDDRVHDLFAQTLWTEAPIGRPILGRRETVGAFDHDKTRAFYEKHYGSGDIVVAAAGNLEHDQLVALVASHLDVCQKPAAARSPEPPEVEERLQVLQKDTEQTHICWGYEGLSANDPDRFVLSVLDSILGGGMSSRLFQEIREKKGLAYSVYAYHSLYRDTGAVTIYAGTRPSNAEEVVKLIRNEVEKIRAEDVTDEELHRAKESLKGSLVLDLESTRTRMSRLGKSSVTRGEILSIDELVERVDAVTKQRLRDMAEKIFSRPHVLAMIGPAEADSVAHLMS